MQLWKSQSTGRKLQVKISADLRANMQNISLHCVNKNSKTRRYSAATSPFSGDPAVYLFSVSDPFRSCLTRTNISFDKIWLAQFFLLRIFSSWQVGGRRRKLQSEKISDAPCVWFTHIAWHWPIYPPSITLNRKHWEVRELYYVRFWACIQKLKWQFVIRMEPRTCKHDPQGSVWEGVFFGGPK